MRRAGKHGETGDDAGDMPKLAVPQLPSAAAAGAAAGNEANDKSNVQTKAGYIWSAW